MIEASRRGFLAGLASLVAAPSIVRAESLMKVRSIIAWKYMPRLLPDPMPLLGETAVPGMRMVLVPCRVTEDRDRSVIARYPGPAPHSFRRSPSGPHYQMREDTFTSGWEPIPGRKMIPLRDEVALTNAARENWRKGIAARADRPQVVSTIISGGRTMRQDDALQTRPLMPIDDAYAIEVARIRSGLGLDGDFVPATRDHGGYVPSLGAESDPVTDPDLIEFDAVVQDLPPLELSPYVTA